MKKVSKILSVMLMVSLMFVLLHSTVLATEDNYQDILDVLNGDTNNTTNTLNTSALRNTINTTATTATTNTTLPKTGIANSTPVVALIAIFGISAGYAYIKIRDYKSL